CLAKPRGESIADLDADLLGKSLAWDWRREVDLAESALANEPVEPVRAARLRAVRGRYSRLVRRSVEGSRGLLGTPGVGRCGRCCHRAHVKELSTWRPAVRSSSACSRSINQSATPPTDR